MNKCEELQRLWTEVKKQMLKMFELGKVLKDEDWVEGKK